MRIFRYLLPYLLLSLFITSAFGQKHELTNDIRFFQNGDSIRNAWAGAMNAPQFSAVDLNKDGTKDLVIFDRDDNTFTPFLNHGTANQIDYQYAPEFKSAFDSCNCVGWALMVDYTCDGNEDILCGTAVSGAWGYRQIVYSPDSMGFQIEYQSLKSRYGPNYIDFYAARIDLPGIIDVDDDGDLDILTFGNFTNYIEYHENTAMDSLGRCDTLILHRESFCWGHFFEDNADNTAHLFDTTLCQLGDFVPPGKTGDNGGQRHTGSTNLLLDLNGDDVKEIVIGDISFNEVYALYNAGNLDYAYMDSVETNFPSYDVPVNVEVYPACFYLDVDNDGIKDLVSSPNTINSASNFMGVCWHKNMGQTNFPDFRYQNHGFLQNTTFDVGSFAAPAFFDHNNDGLMDLLVGNFGYWDTVLNKNIPGLALLENTGTTEDPAFTLIDRDYLGLSDSAAYPNLLGIIPHLADLDGDTDNDLLFGSALGTVYYFENVAPIGNTAMFHFITDNLEQIDVGSFSAPTLFDFDKDNDLDLFIGNQRGFIAYYQNNGDQFTADFDSVTAKWGNIKINDETGSPFSTGHSIPFFIDLEGDGKTELMVGTVTGHIEIIPEPTLNPTDTFSISGQLFDFDFGAYAATAFANIDTSDNPTFVVGNRRGGLQLFRIPPQEKDTNMVSLTDQFEALDGVEIYPNPTAGEVVFRFVDNTSGLIREISIWNNLGQQLTHIQSRETEIVLDLHHLSNGIYYVRISEGVRKFSGKLVFSQ